ncbi:MAG: adenylate kinase family protein [Halodesulfurarchaeum sp.]
MRVAVTGTPGTGKTTAVNELDTDLTVVHLNDVIREEGMYTTVDEDRESVVADLDAIAEWLSGSDDVLFESHLAHYFDADVTVVLRCHPETLERRLLDRGEPRGKARENAESEALDVILSETLTRQDDDCVFEIETTTDSPTETASKIQAVLDGARQPSYGTVDYTDYLEES